MSDLQIDLEKITLEPNDILVVKAHGQMTVEGHNRLVETMKARGFPHHQIWITVNGRLEIVAAKTAEQAAAMVAAHAADSGEAKITHQARALRTSADFVELAYGILWLAPTDKATPSGIAIANARQVLFDELDRDGKMRGVNAAGQAVSWLRFPTPETR